MRWKNNCDKFDIIYLQILSRRPHTYNNPKNEQKDREQ